MRRLLPVLCLLSTVSCLAETRLGPAMQTNDPVQLTHTLHGTKDALESAAFVNRAGQAVVAYRIGWVVVEESKTSLHEGLWMNVPAGVPPGAEADVPGQAVPLDEHVHAYLFYVAEVTYADGSHWAAEAAPLLAQAASR